MNIYFFDAVYDYPHKKRQKDFMNSGGTASALAFDMAIPVLITAIKCHNMPYNDD